MQQLASAFILFDGRPIESTTTLRRMKKSVSEKYPRTDSPWESFIWIQSVRGLKNEKKTLLLLASRRIHQCEREVS